MENINLTKEMITYFKMVSEMSLEEEEILHYYINRNCHKLFGKTSFLANEIEKNSIVSKEINYGKIPYIEEKRVKLFLYILGEKYTLNYQKEKKSLVFQKENSNIGFQIRKNSNGILNTLVIEEEAKTKVEYQNVSIEKQIFDYQTVSYNENQESVSNAYRMSPMGTKIKETEIFNLEQLMPSNAYWHMDEINKTSIFKRFLGSCKEFLEMLKLRGDIVFIDTSYNLNDYEFYLEQIFAKLEEICEKESMSRTLSQN